MVTKLVKKLPELIQSRWAKNGRVKFVITAVGVFSTYLIIGILQEKIMKTPYGANNDDTTGETFKYANTLVDVYLIFGLIFMKIWISIEPQKKDTKPIGYYVVAAFANILAMTTSYTALRWVSYPTQKNFKSCKPVAIMIVSLLFCKRYKIQRYICVLLMVTGVIFFNMYEPKESIDAGMMKSDAKAFNLDNFLIWDYQLLGVSLLAFSLTMDGVLGVFQDKIRAAHRPTSQQMLLSMSAWGSGILLVVVIVTGELVQVYEFSSRHPKVLWQMALFGFAGAVGQMFIYTMVSSFGSLANSITTTVRKFFSVVCSIVFFGHPSNLIQWTGAALVFVTLFVDAFLSRKKKTNCSGTKIPEEPNTDANKPNNSEQVIAIV